ncbi:MAG TPA: phosphatidate cytidylyltransferase [Tepidisphaeraceae bacterium]|nr:phosphatidate cytidylyltransferase [Tepidisphaeraceae bacterium]
MTQETRQRLFGASHAFDSPIVRIFVIAIVAAFVIAPILILLLRRLGKVSPNHYDELMKRYRSWLVLGPLMIVPVLLGAFWTILAVGALSLLCYREYARATGFFRERLMSLLVVAGILAVTFSILDNWHALFTALFPLGAAAIAAVAILPDRPKGYIQRVALAILGFTLFGVCLGYLGFFANDRDFRPILFWLVVCVEMNDIFAYISGKSFGHLKLAPNTSPKKTLGGALGALVLTTTLAALVGHFVFKGTSLDSPGHLIRLGLIISICGQLGDLLISSIKRDLDIKDMGLLFPGHGGWLDRFDSLILVTPAAFNYIGYYRFFGFDPSLRILTGKL